MQQMHIAHYIVKTFVVVVMLLAFGPAQTWADNNCSVNRISDVLPEGQLDRPIIGGNLVAWSALEKDYEIYLYDTGGTELQGINISNNDAGEDRFPRIWQNLIMWSGWDGNDREIYVYDVENPAAGAVNVSNSDGIDDLVPTINDGFIAWQDASGEVLLLDGQTPGKPKVVNAATPSQAYDTRFDYLAISDGLLVWTQVDRGGGPVKIYTYDINNDTHSVINPRSSTIMVDTVATSNRIVAWAERGSGESIIYYQHVDPAISSGTITGLPGALRLYIENNFLVVHSIVNLSSSSRDHNIFVSDLFASSPDPVRVADVPVGDWGRIQLDAGYAVWDSRSTCCDGGIFVLDLHQPRSGVTNLVENFDTGVHVSETGPMLKVVLEPDIFNGIVVWEMNVASDGEILLYDLNNPTNGIKNISLREGSDASPRTNGTSVTWMGIDWANKTREIYVYDCN